MRSKLILVPLDNNKMDTSGYIYPDKGFIEFKDFIQDKNLRTGFWGFSSPIKNISCLKKIDMDNWSIIKLDDCENIIKVDKRLNMVKFKRGYIVFNGNLEKSLEYLKNKEEEYNLEIKKEIVNGI